MRFIAAQFFLRLRERLIELAREHRLRSVARHEQRMSMS
jgi:hypothetical protein